MNDPSHNGATAPERQVTLTDYLHIILRRKWIIALCFAAVLGSTLYFTFTTPPVFEASATLMIEEKGGMQRALFEFPTSAEQTTMIANQVELLKSRLVAEEVVRKLLDSPYRDRVALVANVKDRIGLSFLSAVQALRNGLTVSSVRNTDIIKVSVKAPSPFEAALLANTMADAYNDIDRSMSQGEISQVVSFLEEQLEKKARDLQVSEEALRSFQKEKGVVSLSEEAQETVRQLADFETKYGEAETDLKAYLKRLDYLNEQLGKRKENLEQEISQISSPLIFQLRQEMAEIERRITVRMAQGIDENNPDIKRDKEKLKAIKDRLVEETRNLVLQGVSPDNPLSQAQDLVEKTIAAETEIIALQAKANALSKIVDDYSKKLDTLPDKSLQLARLERAKKVDENLYMMMKEKYEESRITKAGQIGKVRIVDRAIEHKAPISPKKKRNTILGILIGLGLGLGVAFFLEYMDHSLRTIEDVETLGLPIMGTIPVIQAEQTNGFLLPTEKKKSTTEAQKIASRLITHIKPKSPVSEAYRTLRTNLHFTRPEDPVRTILVTSSGPTEGKTTTVANLAITLAHMGSRTLLVDSDLRRPVIHALFGLSKDRGLTNAIIGQLGVKEVVKPTTIENLGVVTCGTVPPNPSELLGSRKMKELVDEMKQHYDVILFDSPPVIAVTDAAVLSSIMDGVLLVIRSGKTQREAVARAFNLLDNVHARILGALLNDVDVSNMYGSYYYYYYYHYYYGKDGERKKRKSRRGEAESHELRG